ncbi:N-acyl homoserine lactonase family protein [Macrococcoides caseolyticum]|uniref:N-acyl homoserine lactonase family protein n=1 Tax=Macrococcoides caseolyticum TaxID=69966 RepID=UPI001F2D6B99|nr:N-acyl homoserine lactonase family protein [Macrococcus caseolyticus]MCE4957300.1 N-acyl homoserine lactonase family protein [Macrococcus caseolyticus]
MANINIHVIQTGYITVDRAMTTQKKSLNPLTHLGFMTSKKNRVQYPVMCFLIEHPEGLILVDTGWHKCVRTEECKELGLQRLIHRAHLPANQSIDEQLYQRGILPEDLDYVLLTHLHSDHVSGLRQVKHAKYIFTSREEMLASSKRVIRYLQKFWDNVDLTCFEFDDTGIGPQGKSYDLFGDGSIELIHAPGHSAGLFMVKIMNKQGKYVLLTSDAALIDASYEQIMLPKHVMNRDALLGALKWIHRTRQDSNCVRILTSHDLNLKEEIISI